MTVEVDAYLVSVLKSAVRADVEYLATRWSDHRLPEIEFQLERALRLVRIVNSFEHQSPKPRQGK